MEGQDEVSCEVQVRGSWIPISISQALRLHKERTMRCVECHGRVRAHSEGKNGNRPHFEHHERHKGCSLGDCFDGVKTIHRRPVL